MLRPGTMGTVNWTDLAVTVLAVVLAVVCGFLAPLVLASHPQWLLLAGIVVLLLVAHRTFGTVILSPLQIVAIGVAGLGVAGWLFYPDVADAHGGAAIRLILGQELMNTTLTLCLVSATSILAGGLLWALVTGRLGRRATVRTQQPATLSPRLRRALLLLSPLPLLMYVAGIGVHNLWLRSSYISEHTGSNALVSLGGQLSIAAVLGLGYLWGLKSARFFVLLVTLAYAAAMFGGGTRRLALIPLVFAIGVFAARLDRRSKILLAAAVVLALYLIQLPLQLRSLPSHGVRAYLEYLPQVMTDQLPVQTTVLNILVGFAIIGATAFAQPAIPTSDLWVSVNPLPGSMSGWYQIADSHRLNDYTPYAGLGELGNAGWAVTIVGCLLLGVVLAHLDFRVRWHLQRGAQMVGLAIVGLSGLFLLFFVQYNLRSAGRMLYYAIALDLVALLWMWHRRRRGVLRAERERREQVRRDRYVAAVMRR